MTEYDTGRDTLLDWLRAACNEYALEPIAIYQKGTETKFPLTVADERDLQEKLRAGGHFAALPKEPAALANVVEVSLVGFLLEQFERQVGGEAIRGTERGYPDIEVSGKMFGDQYHAVDIKVARRSKSGNQTQSRITLYTGNTYFRYPQLHWPVTFRPFQDYASHIDLIAIYTLNEESLNHLDDFDLIVQESWRIGSKQRSSTTREYIGAVMSLADLRTGNGVFACEEEFYAYWRRFPFRIGRSVQQQLDRLLAERGQV